jgi:hypothetical protein
MKLFKQDPIFFILSVGFIIAIIIITSSMVSANYAPRPQIDNCISLSNGKLIVPNEATVTISASCLQEPCYQIPTGFQCQTFSSIQKSNVTECTIIPPAPPENPSGTEPLPPAVPQCDSIQCPMGQTRSATDTAVTCSWSALELDPVKESAYNTQKAAAESTSAVYQESQLYNNLQDYCVYTTTLPCPSMPPATFNATASSFSYITGKPLAEVKKLMNKKIGKKK